MTTPASGKRLLRIERKNSQTPIEKGRPSWLRTRLSMGPEYLDVRQRTGGEGLHTVCQEAGCPNIFECWEDREATFLIGGEHCTRRCDFCQIESARPTGYDRDEPRRVGESVKQLGLRYATITSVCRDDLDDEGAWLCAETIRQVHAQNPGVGVEMLAQDFSAKSELLDQVFEAAPEVFGHNVETVPRLFKQIRPGFDYDRSLSVLAMAHEAGVISKSNLILGMGETDDEVAQALRDIHDAGAELVTITQYLRPNVTLRPVDRWVTPQQFVAFGKLADQIGFMGVMSGPLVRSSYRAGKLYRQAMSGREAKAEALEA